MRQLDLLEPSLENDNRQNFLNAVISGLSQETKVLPTAYLYDARGSALFEEITILDEYYQTRAEIEILTKCAVEWMSSFAPDTVLVEFGSGSSTKTEILLAASAMITAYAAIDVSQAALDAAEARLAMRFPELDIAPLIGDFTAVALPSRFAARPHAGFFPGSTIGNLTPAQAKDLLGSFGSILGQPSPLLIGIDLHKDADRLVAAYDDASGVTAAFNLNLLRRINRELDGNFNLDGFKHLAKYDPHLSRIEMHLVSRQSQAVSIAGHTFSFAKGETIHTENSYKYSIDGFRQLAEEAGWQPDMVWTDDEQLFAVHALVYE